MLERLLRTFRSSTERFPTDAPSPEVIRAWRAISAAWDMLGLAYAELHIASNGDHPSPERVKRIFEQARTWEALADDAEKAR